MLMRNINSNQNDTSLLPKFAIASLEGLMEFNNILIKSEEARTQYVNN